MWHRFDNNLRDAVRRSLHHAARAASGFADPAALAAGLSQEPVNGPSVNALSPDAIAVLERAYEHAANSTQRHIGVEHLKLALQSPHVPPRVPAPITPPTDDDPIEAARLSVGHPRFSGDPYPLYRELRKRPSLHRDPQLPVWVVTGYDEAMAVLRDPRFTVQRRTSRTGGGNADLDVLPDGPVRAQLGVLAAVLARKMIFLDIPEHTRVRNLMNAAFSPRAAESMRPRIQAIADELLDNVQRSGKLDLIRDFALQLPIIVICEMIGFPPPDRDQLKFWADAVSHVLSLRCSLRQEVDARRAMIDMRAYFDGIMRNIRANPGNDLLGTLVRGGYPSSEAEEAELFSNCVFLLGAGHETTTSVIGNGMRVLKSHPDQLEKLRGDPSLMPNAVEELLRFESPVQWTSRQAKEDVILAGQTIARGESVLISLGAANRDPRQFPDPDMLDIIRKDNYRHLAFSGGIHFCLGAALSRVEAQVALATLLRRLPRLHIDCQQKLNWKIGSTIHTLESLPATF